MRATFQICTCMYQLGRAAARGRCLLIVGGGVVQYIEMQLYLWRAFLGL
jgi:hypothetical protein